MIVGQQLNVCSKLSIVLYGNTSACHHQAVRIDINPFSDLHPVKATSFDRCQNEAPLSEMISKQLMQNLHIPFCHRHGMVELKCQLCIALSEFSLFRILYSGIHPYFSAFHTLFLLFSVLSGCSIRLHSRCP